jgi:hypothetical protein
MNPVGNEAVNEAELRELVREAIRRRSGHEAGAAPAAPLVRQHASHALLPLARGGDGDGACLIEPSVRCTHCGYCLSYGH